MNFQTACKMQNLEVGTGPCQLLRPFPFSFFFPGVKSLSGMIQLNGLMRSSDLHMVTLSVPSSPTLFQCLGPAYLLSCSGVLVTIPAVHWLILNGRADTSSAPRLPRLFCSRFGLGIFFSVF